MNTRSKSPDTALVHALIDGFDHATVRALLEAAQAHAATLDVVGTSYPDLRDNADRLRRAAEVLRSANILRAFRDEEKG